MLNILEPPITDTNFDPHGLAHLYVEFGLSGEQSLEQFLETRLAQIPVRGVLRDGLLSAGIGHSLSFRISGYQAEETKSSPSFAGVAHDQVFAFYESI